MEAIVTETKRLTYQEYNSLVNKVAHYLLHAKVQKGDRIAIICDNSHHFPIVFLAAAKIGALIVPINYRLKTEGIRYILEDSTPKILFYEAHFNELNPLLGRLPFIQQEICLSMGGYNSLLEELVEAFPDEEPQVDPIIGDDPALIIYTSGTTGRSKGVVCTHHNMFMAAVGNTATLEWRYRDRFLVLTPLFHISGFVVMASALFRGFTLVTINQFHPLHVWDFLNEEKINLMFSVPGMLNYMYEGLKHRYVDVPSLRMIFCGGAKVPSHLIRGMFDLGYQVIQVYGASEYAGAATFWLPEYGMDTTESAGKAVYMTELKIVDPATGETLPPGEIGEVVCRGPLMFKGYWNMEEATKEVIRNGWYHTRDVGMMDENGLLYVMDRLRDMIITNGENVFPAQVESVIDELEEVEESAVIGVAHPIWGELARAYVVLKKGCVISEQEIIAHVRRYLADHSLHEVVFVDELPKNGMGKVMKFVLRQHANQERA